MSRLLLIADVDPRLRTRMVEALAAPDRTTLAVASGLDLVEKIVQRRPDLLLCGDLLLDMQAQDLMARLEQRGDCPPYLIHSATDSAAAAVHWIRRGALDYVARNEDWLRRLHWRVEQLIAQAESSRQLEHARRQRRQSRRIMQQLIECLPAIAFICDRSGRVLVASGAAQSRGLRPGFETPGHDGNGTDWSPPSAVFDGGTLRREQELQGLLYEARWLAVDETSVLCLALDLGPRRQEERDLRRLEGRRHLEQRMESLGELAGHLGHDVSNQLLVVTGYADLLLQSMPTEAPERGWVEGMRKAADNAVGQIRRLMAFTRVKGASFQTIDLHRLLRDVAADLRRTHSHVTLRLELRARSSVVAAEATRLKEALAQLAANGCESMPGGGELVIQTSNPPAAAEGAQPTHVQLSVRDHGSGMDEATVERIFDPFFTTRRAEGGAGLGLSYAWGCLRSHRGTIDVRSRPGHGSEFRVLLPLSVEGQENASSASGLILLVDDDDTVRSVVQSILKAVGCQVASFADGASALDWFDGGHPLVDLALLDLRMPHLNGWELLQELHGRDPRLRALFMTGWSEDLDPERLGEKHVLGLLHKPFELEQLYTTVQSALATVRQERAEAPA